jgi:hypothetical protein
MSGINGVHALLAFLTQQAHSAKHGSQLKLSVKQLELLLQESRLLNERLLKIEKLLHVSKPEPSVLPSADQVPPARSEGNWPAASMVQDVINRQERQQAYGNWQSAKVPERDAEPYYYREIDPGNEHMISDTKQLLIQRYVASETEQATSNTGTNYGPFRIPTSGSGIDELDSGDGRGRVLLIAVGLAMLMFLLFAGIN